MVKAAVSQTSRRATESVLSDDAAGQHVRPLPRQQLLHEQRRHRTGLPVCLLAAHRISLL